MKKLAVIITMLMVVMALTGCSEKAYVDYIEAMGKTSAEKSGKSSIKLWTKVAFDKDNLTIDEITEISQYSDMRLDMTFQYDMNEKKIAADVYTNAGGAGMDYNFYQDGEKQYICLPIIKKFVTLDPKSYKEQHNEQNNVFEGISDKWLSMLEEDDVVKGENTIIDSEQGQVKAKVVTITLTETQLKTFGKEVVNTLIEQGFVENFIQVDDLDSEELAKIMKKTMDQTAITGFQLTIYIDFDGYLIKEELILSLDMQKIFGDKIESIDVIFEKQNWDIGKDQNIVIPEIKEEEVIDMKGLDNIDTFLGL